MSEQAERRRARREFADHLASKRQWTYSITLTYKEPYYGTEDFTRPQLVEWAAYCQRRLGGMFEYFFVAEHVDEGEFDHMHGLLHVEAGTSDEVRRLLEAAWSPHGFAHMRPFGRGLRARSRASRYIFKRFDSRVPVFSSASLRLDVPQRKKANRERKFWTEGEKVANIEA